MMITTSQVYANNYTDAVDVMNGFRFQCCIKHINLLVANKTVTTNELNVLQQRDNS